MSAENLGMSGTKSQLNITTSVLVSANTPQNTAPKRIGRVVVLVAGSAAGSINDSATVAGAIAANQVFAVPNVAGSYLVDFPCINGIVVTAGTGQTLAVSYD